MGLWGTHREGLALPLPHLLEVSHFTLLAEDCSRRTALPLVPICWGKGKLISREGGNMELHGGPQAWGTVGLLLES